MRYGDHPSQVVDVRDGRRGTVVLLHGGFWRARYGKDLMAPLADDLEPTGWASANVEYRRIGDGGGWPTTFDDVRAAIGALPTPRPFVTVGHSAGGHLALWAAPLVDGSVSLAGVLDLHEAARLRLSDGAVQALLGDDPERYDEAAPKRGGRQLVLHGDADDVVPVSFSTGFDPDAVVLPAVGHMDVIDPAGPAWAEVRGWLARWA